MTPRGETGMSACAAAGLEQWQQEEQASLATVARLVAEDQAQSRPSNGAADGRVDFPNEADTVIISDLLEQGGDQTWDQLVQQQLEVAATVQRCNNEETEACRTAQWWQDGPITRSARNK